MHTHPHPHTHTHTLTNIHIHTAIMKHKYKNTLNPGLRSDWLLVCMALSWLVLGQAGPGSGWSYGQAGPGSGWSWFRLVLGQAGPGSGWFGSRCSVIFRYVQGSSVQSILIRRSTK